MKPIPLVSYQRARPLLLAWAESLGDTLDVCPLPTTDSWVYFSARRGERIKVGWTRRPETRPFECWRDYYPRPMTPAVLISGAGRNVERLVKRAAISFDARKRSTVPNSELFFYDSPVLTLVGELRCVAEASLFCNSLAEKIVARGPNHCWGCGNIGHGVQRCPVRPSAPRLGRSRCSQCRGVGHTMRSCPFLDEEAA